MQSEQCGCSCRSRKEALGGEKMPAGGGPEQSVFGRNCTAEGHVQFVECLAFQKLGELKYSYFDTQVRRFMSKYWEACESEVTSL